MKKECLIRTKTRLEELLLIVENNVLLTLSEEETTELNKETLLEYFDLKKDKAKLEMEIMILKEIIKSIK